MKFMWRTADYIWSDFKQNTEILDELKVIPIQDKISNYKTDWRDHVNRMCRSRLPKLITQYIPKGRGDRGRPMKKLTDGFWGRNRPTLAYILDRQMMTSEIVVGITVYVFFNNFSNGKQNMHFFPYEVLVSRILPSKMHITITCYMPFTLRLTLPVIEPRFGGHSARSLVVISTGILQLNSVPVLWRSIRFVPAQVCLLCSIFRCLFKYAQSTGQIRW
jgi:hypothetical protein